jgi:hypothetical protein
MKTKIIGFILSLFLTTTLFSQDWENAIHPTPGFATLNEAARMARTITDAAGVEPNFKIAEARVPNAMAVIHGGKRYILYNPAFISLLTRATGTKWSAISVLAHEIGHHLYSPSVNKGKVPMANELEADEFSGYVLGKLGATQEEAEVAIRLLASERASATHPGRDERVSSIAKGYKRSGAITTTNNSSVTTTVTPSRKVVEEEASVQANQTALPASNIVAAIRFNADPSNQYYVTTRLNVVRVADNRISVIGKLAKLNSRDYPFVIYDQSDSKVFVKSTGDLVNKGGSVIGKLSMQG